MAPKKGDAKATKSSEKTRAEAKKKVPDAASYWFWNLLARCWLSMTIRLATDFALGNILQGCRG